MKINIAVIADNNYAQHLCVTLFSLLKYGSKNDYYCIHLLNDGINKNNLEKIQKSLKPFLNKQILLYKVDKRIFSKQKAILHISKTAYFKILLPNILKHINKVLYLDCDLLIYKNLKSLYKIKIENQYLIGAVQIFHPNYKQVLNKQFQTNLSLCFNTGVMIMNLQKMRNLSISKNLMTFADKYSNKLLTADQDIFNIIINTKVKKLENRWNVGSYVLYAKNHLNCHLNKKEFIKIKINPAIVHFDGGKPWNCGNFHPYKKEYFKILDQTEFRLWRPKFKLKKFLSGVSFHIAIALINFLPNKVHDYLESFYLKHNFLEKIYSNSQN